MSELEIEPWQHNTKSPALPIRLHSLLASVSVFFTSSRRLVANILCLRKLLFICPCDIYSPVQGSLFNESNWNLKTEICKSTGGLFRNLLLQLSCRILLCPQIPHGNYDALNAGDLRENGPALGDCVC